MKKKKISIIIIVLVLIGIFFLSFYLYVNRKENKKAMLLDKDLITQKDYVSISLEKIIEEENQNWTEVPGLATTTFQKNDLVRIMGECFVTKKSEGFFRILDDEGNLIKEFYAGSKTVKPGKGIIRLCCLSIPKETGHYKLEAYLNNEKVGSVDFEVIN